MFEKSKLLGEGFDALGDALGDAIGDAIGDTLGDALGNVLGNEKVHLGEHAVVS